MREKNQKDKNMPSEKGMEGGGGGGEEDFKNYT